MGRDRGAGVGRGGPVYRLAELIADHSTGSGGNCAEEGRAQFTLAARHNRGDHRRDGGEEGAEEAALPMARGIDERHRVVLHVA